MEYVDIPFPPRIAMGAQRQTGWKTVVTQTQGGAENTNQNWSKARHSFDVSFAVRTSTDYDAVVAHFHQVRGRAKSFPFKDALDYRVEASSGVLLDDGDSPTTGYHMAKRYGSGAYAYDRTITRPKTGTLAFYRLRSGSTTAITGNATVDYDIGWVTFTGGTVIGGDVLSWSGQFWVPSRYDTDDLPAVAVDRQPGGGDLLVRCDSIPIVEVRE